MRLEVEDVHVAYGRTEVLFGVSLEVPDGALVCLMGRNGVGKTTLLNAIMGLLPTSSGTVRLDGRDLAGVPIHKRAQAGIGYVPQGHQVFPHLTAMENLRVVFEGTKSKDRSAIDDALDVFPALRKLLDRPAGLLSGGQAQQLAIARALHFGARHVVFRDWRPQIQGEILPQPGHGLAAVVALGSAARGL